MKTLRLSTVAAVAAIATVACFVLAFPAAFGVGGPPTALRPVSIRGDVRSVASETRPVLRPGAVLRRLVIVLDEFAFPGFLAF